MYPRCALELLFLVLFVRVRYLWAAQHGDAAGADELDNLVVAEEVDERVDVVLVAGGFDDDRVGLDVDDLGFEDLGNVDDVAPRLLSAFTFTIASSRLTMSSCETSRM